MIFAAGAGASDDDFRESLEAIIDAANASDVRIDYRSVVALVRQYDRLDLTPADIAEAGPGQLKKRYLRLDDASFYAPAPVLALALRDTAVALHRRGQTFVQRQKMPPENVLQRVYWRLITARLFDEAKTLAREFALTDIAHFDGPGTQSQIEVVPSVLRFSGKDGQYRLERTNVDLDGGPLVVAVVHPYCGFSRAAMTWIEQHVDALVLFTDRIVWVAPQMELDDVEALEAWNRRARLVTIDVMDDENSWPANMRFNATPVFYFVRDGHVVERTSGWPGDWEGEELMRRIGALFGSEAKTRKPGRSNSAVAIDRSRSKISAG